ncbi:MAG TPA: HD domain-containing protein [Candidatus Saccharimonadales bacterium]
MSKIPDSKRLIELQEMLLHFQAIERFTRNPHDTQKRENDVEHSYHLAMAAWLLAPHFNLDAGKAIRIALAHDLVEIYSGDTFAFGTQDELDTKDEREHQALDRLKNEWPDFGDMIICIEDYKDKVSEEAKFVYALDKVTPIIMNFLGKGAVWQKHGVTIDKFIAEKERKIPKDSPIYPYYQELLEMLRQTPHYFHQEK